MKRTMLFCFGLLGWAASSGQKTAAAQGLDSAAVSVMRAPLAHPVRVEVDGVRLEWRGVYIRNGLLWLSFRASNRSAIDFRADPVRVYLRDRKALRRRAAQELALRPVFRKEVGVLAAGRSVLFCVALVPRAPGRGREMVVEWVERDGDRRIRIAIRGKRILKAIKLNQGR